jgi:hypothetical protein
MKQKIAYLRSRLMFYRHAPLMLFAGRILSFILAGIGLGMLSAWYMIDHGTALTTAHAGPWQSWINSGVVDADPYTRANTARSGRLPMTTSNALYFSAREDSEGDTLNASCDYLVSGKSLDSDWWSFAVYRPDGRPIRNASHRTSFNSTDVLRQANGGYQIALAPRARPGNWIDTSGNDDMVLMLRLYSIHVTKDTQRGTAIEQSLPEIRRLDCR